MVELIQQHPAGRITQRHKAIHDAPGHRRPTRLVSPVIGDPLLIEREVLTPNLRDPPRTLPITFAASPMAGARCLRIPVQ